MAKKGTREMNYESPFTRWWDANITQMAVSPDIRRLIAMAFEGGQISAKPRELSDDEICDIWLDVFSNNSTAERQLIFARAILKKAQEK